MPANYDQETKCKLKTSRPNGYAPSQRHTIRRSKGPGTAKRTGTQPKPKNTSLKKVSHCCCCCCCCCGTCFPLTGLDSKTRVVFRCRFWGIQLKKILKKNQELCRPTDRPPPDRLPTVDQAYGRRATFTVTAFKDSGPARYTLKRHVQTFCFAANKDMYRLTSRQHYILAEALFSFRHGLSGAGSPVRAGPSP